MSQICIYACGGTGVNIGKQITDLDIQVNFIDTSESNLKAIKSQDIFLVEDMDGAGKHRATTYNKFKDIAEDVLIKLKPSNTLNVVVSSLSGGSGSILAPMITKQLIETGLNTIAIGIDSKNSLIELDNTIKTLKTYKSISDTVKKAISLYYIENTIRRKADEEAINFINLLALLIDKYNTEEFDTSDLKNFINFDKVTDNAPSVSIIDVSANTEITPEKNTVVVSSILVTKDKHTTIKPVIPEYLSTCIVTDPNYRVEDLRINNTLGKLSIIVDNLEKQIKEYQDNKKINKFKEIENIESNSDGIVL